MAYTILNTDGTTLLLLADGRVDDSTTSLTLIGKNVPSYGEYINNNFIKLLANFASTAGNPPRTPLLGQLWYDTSAQRLKIYDNGFKAVGGAIVADNNPGNLTTGDLWYDGTNRQLKIFANNTVNLIGPAYPISVGENGLILPSTSIYDDLDVIQDVTLLKNYGETVGMISNVEFIPSTNDRILYFGTSTTATVVAGLTLFNDLKVIGKSLDRLLSANFALDQIITLNSDPMNFVEYNLQNSTVTTLLSAMYPIQANTVTNEVGLLEGTEARVSLTYEAGTGGTQIRRYVVKKQFGFTTLSWQPYEVYTTAFPNDGFGNPLTTSSNIMIDLGT